MLKADGDRLAAIGHRAAADGDKKVGRGLTRGIGASDHGVARRMRRQLIVNARKAGAQCQSHHVDFVGLRIEGAAGQNEHPVRPEPVCLGDDGLGCGAAENDAVHPGEHHRA